MTARSLTSANASPGNFAEAQGTATVACHSRCGSSQRRRRLFLSSHFLVLFSHFFAALLLLAGHLAPAQSNPKAVHQAHLHPKASRVKPAASAPPGTGGLDFLGQVTVISPASNDNYYGLLRQSNCTITEYSANVSQATHSSVPVTPTANFQDYLHTVSGLTTTAGVYANGCKDAEFGIPARFGAYLGPTKDGSNIVGAFIDYNNNLKTGVANLTTGDFTGTTLLTGSANLLLAADLNGDGLSDLLVETFSTSGSGASPIKVFLNNGDGTFTAGTSVLSSTAYFGMTVDDVNGDGKYDLVVTTANSIIVLPGNGDGTFGTAVTSTISSSTGTSWMATGDFNDDGKKDLILGNGLVLLGNGAGSFTAAPKQISLPSSSGVPVVGDWNNDGKLDLAFQFINSNTLATYIGAGDGTFSPGASYSTVGNIWYVSAADLDGDGNTDLVLGEGNGGYFGPDWNSNGTFQVLMGRGDGTFAGAQSLSGKAGFAPADFHGKGYVDGLGITSAGIELYTNNGSGSFAVSTAISGVNASSVAAADMNGDGKADAVFVEYNSNTSAYDIAVALGNGDGTFQASTTTTIAATGSVQVGDFNGDGKLDVIFVSGTNVYLLLNQGNGQLGAPTLLATEPNPVAGSAIGDLRANGKLDIVLSESTLDQATSQGAVVVLLGNGDGTFQTGVNYTINYSPLALTLSDVNKDGKLDLLAFSTDQYFDTTNLYTLLGKGDGTFGSPITTPMPQAFATNIGAADFDGDGNIDVVLGFCCGVINAYVAFGNGTGNFATPVSLPLAASAGQVQAIDVNGDGRPDILSQSLEQNPVALTVLLNEYGSAATLTPTATKLSASATTVTAGTSITFTATVAPSTGTGTPTGTLTFYDGTTSLGTGTLSSGRATYSTSALAAGAHSISASYGGDTSFSTSSSTAVAVTINPAVVQVGTSTALTTSASSITAGQSVTFTATVTPASGSAIPTGTVTFADAAGNLGTGTLNTEGVATFATASLPVGPQSITASYGGDTNFTASESTAVAVVVTAAVTPDFSLTLSPTTGTASQSGSAQTTISITPSGDFAGAVALSCAGLPQHTSCNFAPASLTPTGTAAVTSALTIETGVSASALLAQPQLPGKPGAGAVTLASLGGGAFLGLLLMGSRRRNKRWLYTQLGLGFALLLIPATIGCGGTTNNTPAGAYQITVTATSGSTTHTATFTLTVQQ
jgi:Bacterial Ig-like domain (group 3)/FG-GAP-like repeat